MIIHPSAKKDISIIAFGEENTFMTEPLNNFDLKNLKKKQIIEKLKFKEVEALRLQVVKEDQRFQQMEKEFETLQKLKKIGKTSYLKGINNGLMILIGLFVVLILGRFIIGYLNSIDNYPVESIVLEYN